jgi:hypothetical protein
MKTKFHEIIFRQQEPKQNETGSLFPGMTKTKCEKLQCILSYETLDASKASIHFALYTLRTKALD